MILKIVNENMLVRNKKPEVVLKSDTLFYHTALIQILNKWEHCLNRQFMCGKKLTVGVE